MADRLTPQQEKFCQKYIECRGNATEAYRQSYDCKESSYNTIKTEAYKLLQNPYLTHTIEMLQAKHAERHAVTVDSLTEELDEAKNFAYTEKQTAAAVSAIMGKAKIHGFDKQILGGEIKTIVKIVDMTGKKDDGV